MGNRTTSTGGDFTLVRLPCACSNLRRASRAVTQLYAQELREAGLEPTQLTLLVALSRRPGIPQGRLAAPLALDATTLTRTLARLRTKGWVEALPGADRREKLLRLTPAGRSQLRRALPPWERAQRRLRRALRRGNWERLQAALDRVTEAAQTA